MSIVSADISMSLDGFVTGPHPSQEHGLGDGGEAIQHWATRSHESPRDRTLLEKSSEATGAIVMGRRTFDFIDEPHGWGDDINYGYDHGGPAHPPAFVVTRQAPPNPRHTQGFTFVIDGLRSAISLAQDAAGDLEVVLMGGAELIDRALGAGLVNQLRIHVSPVIMGHGTRLFELVDGPISLTQADVTVTPLATHLTYDLR